MQASVFWRKGVLGLLLLVAAMLALILSRRETAKPSNVPTPDPEICYNFENWVERYVQTKDFATRESLEQKGVALALERRASLRALIQTDPRQALKQAVPLDILAQLPGSIQGLLEERISARGDFDVLATLPLPGVRNEAPPIQRSIQIGERKYRAFVYGRREELPTRKNIPVHGIAVDDVVALHEEPVRDFEPGELQKLGGVPGEAICAVSSKPATTAVDVGGQIQWLCHYAHKEQLHQRLLASAARLGGGDDAAPDGEVAESPYTEGRKR